MASPVRPTRTLSEVRKHTGATTLSTPSAKLQDWADMSEKDKALASFGPGIKDVEELTQCVMYFYIHPDTPPDSWSSPSDRKPHELWQQYRALDHVGATTYKRVCGCDGGEVTCPYCSSHLWRWLLSLPRGMGVESLEVEAEHHVGQYGPGTVVGTTSMGQLWNFYKENRA